MRREKILVTGGAGYIGSILVPLLLQEGFKVRVLDSLRRGIDPLLPVLASNDIELIKGDVCDDRELRTALCGVDAVVNLAAIVDFPACKWNPIAARPEPLEANAIAGRMASAVAAVSRPLNPMLRLLQSPSAAVRDIAGKLFENSVYLKKNFQGVASEQAVETLMKEWNGGLVKAITSMDGAFSDYAKGGGQLRYKEFKEAVGRATRRGDESPIPEVAKVAKAWRSQVFDPLKEAAIKAGLLPEDVSVDTATSYFSRMWNRNRLIGQEGRFKQIVTDYYHDAIGNEYEKARTAFNARMGKLDQEAEDLNLTPEQRTARLGELETAISEHEESGSAYLDLSEKADRLSEIASDMRRLKDNDTMVARQNMAALRDAAKSIKEAGGKDLEDFIAKRSELQVRRRNVDLGAAGLAERSHQVMESLADLEEATQRSLGRLSGKAKSSNANSTSSTRKSCRNASLP